MSLLKELQKKNFKEAVEREGSILSIERSLELKKKYRYKLYRFLKNGNCADISLIVSISRYLNLKIKNEAEKELGQGLYREYDIFLADFTGKKEMTAVMFDNGQIIHIERNYGEILLKKICTNAEKNKEDKNGQGKTSRNSKRGRR